MLSSLKPSDRLRALGVLVLALGIGGACLFYVLAPRSATPALDDTNLPGYTRARNREMGQLMGHFGVMMMDWQDGLDRPGPQAVLIAAGAALVSVYFFRAAWVLDDDERDRLRPPA